MMTKKECIELYRDLIEVGRKIMRVETRLSKALLADVHAFDDVYDKLAYTIFDAIVKLKFEKDDIKPSEYEAFLKPRIDQHMADYLEMIQENELPITNSWIGENVDFMLED